MADFLDTDDATDPWAIPSDEGQAEPVKQEQEQAVEAQAEAVQPDPAATQEEQTAEEKFNPTLYREMKEERAKRQAAEARAKELEALVAKAPVQPHDANQIPDAYEDPEGFNRYQEQRFQQTEWNLRASMSERFAKQQHGEEAVNEATEWGLERAKGDPGFAQKVMAHPDPVGFTLTEYKQSKTLETLAGRPFEDAAKDYAISQGWIVSEPGAAQAAPILKPSPAAPPKGLSSAPGKGGISQTPQGAEWSEVKFALG